ncbi:MAG: efflux RND transporter periplasmic adaptor subunit [Bacteroidia bacterium]
MKKRNYTWWIVGGIVILIFGLGIYKKVTGKKGTEVSWEETEVRTIYATVSESGTVQPTVEVKVAPDVSGEVVFLAVQEGMKVKKGDLLVTIQPEDYRAALEQSRASLNGARAGEAQAQAAVAQARANMLQDSVNLARTQKLFDDKVVSKSELENAQLRYAISRSQFSSAEFQTRAAFYQVKNAEASVKQASQTLKRTNIYASMDGTATAVNVEMGERVVGTSMMTGTEILRIADLSRMEVVVEISENDIVNLSLGDSAKIEVDALPDAEFYGKVSEIAYSAQTTGLGSTDQVTNFEVKIAITPASYTPAQGQGRELPVGDSPFRPGMTALVDIYTDMAEQVVTAPIQAITLRDSEKAKKDSVTIRKTGGAEKKDEEEQDEVVFVVNDGKVSKRIIHTGISDDNYMVITDGLKEGENVVTGPYTILTKELKDGDEVVKKIEKKEK